MTDPTPDTISTHGEAALIAAACAACPSPPSPSGPGDDCALLPSSAGARVITTDALIEGTHFIPQHPPEALGHKALATNLSDVAAMGATPEAFLLTVGLPPTLSWPRWLAFCRGLGAYARASNVYLAGGDTVRSPIFTISITAWGSTPPRTHPLTRTGARPGDRLWLLGTPGLAALGLTRWLTTPNAPPDLTLDPALAAQLAPNPPLWAGPLALELGATAGMDLSDGLAADLFRLARASSVSIVCDLDLLPDPHGLLPDPISRATGGEDYALLVTAPESASAALAAHGFTSIGAVLERDPTTSEPVLWRLGGRLIATPQPAFIHFDRN